MNKEPFEVAFYAAGVQYHKLYNIISDLKEGDVVQLVPEPTNKYDKYAIRIESNNVMLGYVPRVLSLSIFAKLNFGAILNATISKLSPESDPWTVLKIEVKEESKDE